MGYMSRDTRMRNNDLPVCVCTVHEIRPLKIEYLETVGDRG